MPKWDITRKSRAAFACVSQLFHCELTDGDGCGSTGGESDSHFICATGVVVAAGQIAEDKSSAVLTRGLQLGNRAGDGRGRAAWPCLCVQTEAERECEAVDRPAVRR